MDGLVRFLKDQPFGPVNAIMLMNQGALKKIGMLSPHLIFGAVNAIILMNQGALYKSRWVQAGSCLLNPR